MEKAGNGEKQFQEKLKNSICCNTMKMKLKNSLFSKKIGRIYLFSLESWYNVVIVKRFQVQEDYYG